MRTMADGVDASRLPLDIDLVAGYVDGRYRWSPAAWARFGDRPQVRIATSPGTNDGNCLDVERYDASPADVPGWATRRRAVGVDPSVYCAVDTVAAVRAACADAGVAMPHLWVAAWPGIGGQLYPGTVAHQYASYDGYDASVVADDWPGVDPAQTPPVPPPPVQPPATTYPGESMRSDSVTVRISNGVGWVPLPVPAGQLVSVAVQTEDPAAVGRYDDVPRWTGVASQPNPAAPNGVATFAGTSDGVWGVVLWSVTVG